MKIVFPLITLLLALLKPESVSAQKIFSEGVIKYDVYVNNEEKPSGLYVVSIKSGNIKRELAMNSGYNNITIYTKKNGKTLSMNITGGEKYALEISQEELNEKNTKFADAVFSNLNTDKTIAGYHCMGNKVVYKDMETAEFYYTPDLLPPAENLVSMFPGLRGIPLQYEIKSNNTLTFKFVATLIDNMVIDSKIFNAPADYKIVTRAELEKLK
jgi:hypothetical protein